MTSPNVTRPTRSARWKALIGVVFAIAVLPACGVYMYDDANPDDRDGDGLYDWEERDYGTDPYDSDTDRDGLYDGEEVFDYGTDPLYADTDDDGLLDGEEVFEYYTDPLYWDSDDDGFSDGREIRQGTDPLRYTY